MKSFKSFVTLSTLALVGTLVVSCGGTPVSSSESSSVATSSVEVTTKDVSAGLGLIVGTSLIKDSTGLKSVNVTGAAASFDSDGKVVSVEYDVMQIPVVVVDGNVALNATATQVKDAGDKVVETKQELTTRYGMISNSTIGKEAYEQLRAFADYAKGKTIEEIEAEKDASGYPTGTLASSVSVNVTYYINALKEAFATKKAAVKVANDAVLSTGLGMTVAVGTNKVTVTASNITVDASDKIEGAVVDVLEIPFTVTEGLISITATAKQVVDAGAKVVETKKELGDRYGMKAGNPEAVGEWYQQAAAYEDWLVDQPTTVLDFTGTNFEAGHELVAAVTIKVNTFFATAKEAAAYAKALPVPPVA